MSEVAKWRCYPGAEPGKRDWQGLPVPWRERWREKRWSYGGAITFFEKEEEWRISHLSACVTLCLPHCDLSSFSS